MKKNLRILQVDIGSGSQWGDSSTDQILRNVCIPSVEQYALKYGYHYERIENSSYSERIGEMNFLPTKEKHYSFERYFHLYSKFAATIYIDTDVYIKNEASPLPNIDGLMAVAEPGFTNSRNIFINLNHLPGDTDYFNSGIFMADQKTGKILSQYMIERAINKIQSKGKNTDNMMFNEFLLEKKVAFTPLTESWNYMPVLSGSTPGLNSNFMHLVGIPGKNLLTQIINKKLPIRETLENIANGKLLVNT